ncbi:MAG: hypothetical protein Kow00107_08650 [Planctomycetota bacterium]
MHEILMGFGLGYWHPNAIIEGIEEISETGFPGFEGTPHLVDRYEDRIEVFTEILERTDIELVAICSHSNFLIEDKTEEEIEIDMNIARFLHNVGAQFLVVTGGPRRPEGNTDEDWANFLRSIEELGARAIKSSIQLCIMPYHGTIVENGEDIDRLMSSTPDDLVYLAPDLGEFRARNVDSVEYIKKYFERIPYIRFRDVLDKRFMGRPRLIAKARMDGSPLAVPVGVPFGTGLTDMQPAWELLNEMEFEGWAMSVVEEPRNKSTQVIRACRQYLEQNMEIVF